MHLGARLARGAVVAGVARADAPAQADAALAAAARAAADVLADAWRARRRRAGGDAHARGGARGRGAQRLVAEPRRRVVVYAPAVEPEMEWGGWG